MGKGFRSSPKPDAEVVALLEGVLESARAGIVRSVAVVAVNPLNQVEHGTAGDLSDIRTNAILAGLTRTTLALVGGRHG